MNKLICVYGSLRKGQYNFERFEDYAEKLKETFKVYKEDVKVYGYKLYSLGPYPGIKKTEDDDVSYIMCDVLECSEKIFNMINSMELGANYKLDIIEIENEECFIYPYLGNVIDKNLVTSGDWNEYNYKFGSI